MRTKKDFAKIPQALFTDAYRCSAVIEAATRLQDALIESAEASTPEALIASACDESQGSGTPVLDLLTKRIENVQLVTQINRKHDRAARELADQIKAEWADRMRGVPYAFFQKQVALERLQAQISRAPKARAESAEKYRQAGLSPNQIAAIGIEPSEATEAAWGEEAAQIARELASLKAFMADPFDKTLLEGVEIAPLPVAPDALQPPHSATFLVG